MIDVWDEATKSVSSQKHFLSLMPSPRVCRLVRRVVGKLGQNVNASRSGGRDVERSHGRDLRDLEKFCKVTFHDSSSKIINVTNSACLTIHAKIFGNKRVGHEESGLGCNRHRRNHLRMLGTHKALTSRSTRSHDTKLASAYLNQCTNVLIEHEMEIVIHALHESHEREVKKS